MVIIEQNIEILHNERRVRHSIDRTIMVDGKAIPNLAGGIDVIKDF